VSSEDYFRTRFTLDSRRQVLWAALYRHYFSRYIRPEFTVLELGAGYGYFINNVNATRRIAVDHWAGMTDFLDKGVEPHIGPIQNLDFLEDRSVDYTFASNVFEHLSKDDLTSTLNGLRAKLKSGGTLTIVGPNYRFCYDEYFDDYTHVSVFSDRSLADFVEAHGFKVVDTVPRFMPLTIKSRLRVSESLIRLYLLSPIKPLGKQMLLRAVNP
jgi:cyclopropane fatty-acyl-phospholipid synthase-like methyltransferase